MAIHYCWYKALLLSLSRYLIIHICMYAKGSVFLQLSFFVPAQEDGVNLLSVIKGANMYRRGRQRDSVTDYLPPTLSEFRQTFDVDHR
jgi:hypothetical protein